MNIKHTTIMVIISLCLFANMHVSAQPLHPQDFEVRLNYKLIEERFFLVSDPQELSILDRIRMNKTFEMKDICKYQLGANEEVTIIECLAFEEVEGSGITPPAYTMITNEAIFSYNELGDMVLETLHSDDYLELAMNKAGNLFFNFPSISDERINELQNMGAIIQENGNQVHIKLNRVELFVDFDNLIVESKFFDDNQQLLSAELNLYQELSGGEVVKWVRQQTEYMALEDGPCIEQVFYQVYSNYDVQYGKSSGKSSSLLEQDNQILVFPNPTKNIVQFRWNNDLKDQIELLRVFGSKGQEIGRWSKIDIQKNELDISSWAPGIYHFLFQGRTFQSVKTVIKN